MFLRSIDMAINVKNPTVGNIAVFDVDFVPGTGPMRQGLKLGSSDKCIKSSSPFEGSN